MPAIMAIALLIINRDLVSATPDLITRVDAEGIILYVNHVIRSVFGFDPE
ncbi:MAG: PAS domain-containing protein [Phaeospirillum sp.]|nr:PAS domain-containing protein [Phaeospirillum sp.]